jgi:hypothetical protein
MAAYPTHCPSGSLSEDGFASAFVFVFGIQFDIPHSLVPCSLFLVPCLHFAFPSTFDIRHSVFDIQL